mmetsp:Transcript_26277/g.63431  ORF Transcript_26277/g.63431 Transcript_26277/m.63431 type:complete len:81 (+) Transcript_26277:3-245(+)
MELVTRRTEPLTGIAALRYTNVPGGIICPWLDITHVCPPAGTPDDGAGRGEESCVPGGGTGTELGTSSVVGLRRTGAGAY